LSSATACKTIGHAISLASSGDTVMVAPATYTEDLTIVISLKIVGSGASSTIIDGRGGNRVVTICNSVTSSYWCSGASNPPSATPNVTLSQLTIQNGGQGIRNFGVLKLTNSVVRNNSINFNCIGSCAVYGAGINNGGALTITNSTIAKNSIHIQCSHLPTKGWRFCIAFGGGIYNLGQLRVEETQEL
jgi:hypothetical protein